MMSQHNVELYRLGCYFQDFYRGYSLETLQNPQNNTDKTYKSPLSGLTRSPVQNLDLHVHVDIVSASSDGWCSVRKYREIDDAMYTPVLYKAVKIHF